MKEINEVVKKVFNSRNIVAVLMLLSLLLLVISCLGCSGIGKEVTKVTDAITNLSAHKTWGKKAFMSKV